MQRFKMLIILMTLMIVPTLAQAKTWKVDPVHSSVSFKVRHLFSKVPGQFNDFSGTIHFDPKKPEAASVEAEVQAASIDTDNEKRDGHLKSADFFEVETYPTITFKSTEVKPGDDGIEVTGDFTMHGVTKPVTFEVEFLGAGPHPMMDGAMVAGFSATTTINRKDFGISWNKVLDAGGAMLGEDVEIQIDIEAIEDVEMTE